MKQKKRCPAAVGLLTAGALLSLALSGSGAAVAEVPGEQAVPAAAVVRESARKVVPLGRAVGIKLFSDGVLVVGMSELETGQGSVNPGRDSGLKTGDVITHVNGQEVDTVEQVQTILREEGERPLTLRASRSGTVVQLSAQAVESGQGNYKLGVWLRDSMAGIGTMTFWDPDSNTFGALGHGINDVDTAQLMPMEAGSIMYATVSDVKRGQAGTPGELHGSFDVTRDLGSLSANTPCGIYGVLTDASDFPLHQQMEVARFEDVKLGKASILSNIAGDTVQEYDVEITKIYPTAPEETRNMMIKVTDPDLLSQTGGIVQGMSGSPIIQDGKLVGAVTHVLVNDPTKGYGIFIENMLEAAG